jgi:hypothetical protein
MRKSPRLVDLLFEQEEKDDKEKLSKDAVNVAKKDMPSIKDGPSAMLKFLNGPGADPRVRALLAAGTRDGAPQDEKADPKSASPSVGELKPTQVEIELTKSIAYPLAKFKAYKTMMSGDVQKIGPPDNDHIVINGDLIIDGHHRWSSLFSVTGPTGKIAAYDLGIPLSDATSVLATVQVGIAATLSDGEPVPKAKAGGKNILGKGKDEIKSLIEDSIGESTEAGEILSEDFVNSCLGDTEVSKHIGLKSGMDVDEARAVIIEKTADNLSKMQQPAKGAPPRVDMPQLDKATGGVKGVIKDFQAGEVNYKAPFGESRKRKDDVVMERWARLAGILKD